MVEAELYFLYFIFLSESSGAAPASTSLAVENLLLVSYSACFQQLQRRVEELLPLGCWFALEQEMLCYAAMASHCLLL